MANAFKNIPTKDITRDMYDEGLRAVAGKFQGYDIKPVWNTRTIIAQKAGTVPDIHPHVFIISDGKQYVLDVSGQGDFMNFAIPLSGVHVTKSKVLDTSDIEDAVIIEEEKKADEPKTKIEMSPMLKQFYDLKKKHPDALLLFRCGDFFETYDKDARDASKVLGITLTKSTKTKDKKGKPLCMAGFPYTALDTYLPKLIRAGIRVAICDQIEDPKSKAVTKTVSTPKEEPTAVPEQEYDVDITESLFRSVRIKASSKQEAIEKVAAMYDNKEIVFSMEDSTKSPIIDANIHVPQEPPKDYDPDLDIELD